MLKVYMLPTPEQAVTDTTNAIHQIVLKLQKFLPAYDIEIVSHREGADLIVGHAGQTSGFGAVDVAHCHGLYPTAYPDLAVGWHYAANRAVVNNLVGARAVTVPSQWVADILRRDMHLDPHVIGWAIEPDDWPYGTSEGYILWNKTRDEGVCSPKPLVELALRAKNRPFVSTFGAGAPNINTIGRVTYEEMRRWIRGAAVYLATTKETFGIGTLEAMVTGVPVLGFRHGATPDLVEHGVSGFLVEPGDYDGLLTGLEWCLKHRQVLGKNARTIALTYTWDKVAAQFASIYHGLMESKNQSPKVSVIIPCYNYSRFVGDAIKSVASQQTEFGVELIVVDDGSTDGSYAAAQEAISIPSDCLSHAQVIQQSNAGVAAARNRGINAAQGKYIVCLDADDKLGDSRFLQTLADALDNNLQLGVVFTGITMMDESGNLGNHAPWPRGYDYDAQVRGQNQIPTCCMFRKVAWQRAGGYRAKYTPAEDAALWLAIGALGFRAQQITEEGWFHYRLHGNSLSTPVRTGQKIEPNWKDRVWITDGLRPFASDGKPPQHSWPVRNYDKPKVSVIVPVGSYHRHLLDEAIDSIENQTERNWELILVNDSSELLILPAYPFAKIVNTGGGKGAAVARNMGIQAATAPFVTFLDADDIFHSRFLELTLREHNRTGKYVYTDWVSYTLDGRVEKNQTPDYDPNEVFRRTSIHSINILIPRQVLLDCGGFDESMPSWEDVGLFMELAARGYCGTRLPEALIMYRYTTGQLREKGEQIKDTLIQYLRNKYRKYIVEEEQVCCGNAKPKKAGVLPEFTAQEKADGKDQLVRIEYQGGTGLHEVIGTATGQRYGRKEKGDTFYVYVADQIAMYDLFMVLDDVVSSSIQPTTIPTDPVSLT